MAGFIRGSSHQQSRRSNSEIVVRLHKSCCSRKPISLEIPILPELQRIVDATTPLGKDTYLVTKFGKPFSADGFGNRFRKWCDEAGLPHCSAHGLRKAGSAGLAELGASDREIMAITGHQTAKADRYQGARQKLLAATAMAKWAGTKRKIVPP
jgi:integrase